MHIFNSLFPLWAILVAIIGYFFPSPFTQFQAAIVPGLAAVMFMMGLTLTRQDFLRIAKNPTPILVGLILQFLLMPLIAITLSKSLQLAPQLTAGVVLVGCCAGGTASNVMAYLAKGDVALSVSMTMASTLTGVLATPLLTAFYLSTTVEVDTLGLLLSIVQIVLAPVLLGAAVNHLLHSTVRKMEPFLPTCAIIFILFLITVVVALNANNLLDIGAMTLAVVILHNVMGLTGGYYLSRFFGFSVKQSHTIAIEVGMQNSGLAVALALQFFSTTAALPGVLFSVWHNISGSMLATYWGRNRASEEKPLSGKDTAEPKP